MTPTEAIAKLEADFAPDEEVKQFSGKALCEVPGPIFDALIAVAKAAAEIEFVFGSGGIEQAIHRNDLVGLKVALALLGEAVSDAN